MPETTDVYALQSQITRLNNQIQALVSAQLFTLGTLLTIGPSAGLEPSEIEALRGQVNALHTLKTRH
jgi:hypothetical protein